MHKKPSLNLNVVLRIAALLACLLVIPSRAEAGNSLMVYDFNLGPDPVSNVDNMKSLGFGGLVTTVRFPGDLVKLQTYADHVSTVNDFELLAYVNFDFNDPTSQQVWRDALPILARAGAPLWVIVNNAPSVSDLRFLLLQMARRSQLFGVRTVIYPHWNTSIETAAEAASHIAALAHPNLRNSLHTCHEIRGGNQYSMRAVVSAQANGFDLVAIAGADENAYAGPVSGAPPTWEDAIKPLDKGDYSLLPFLQAVKDSGYDGPVILQTFGILDDPGHLQRSLQGYARYRSHLL